MNNHESNVLQMHISTKLIVHLQDGFSGHFFVFLKFFIFLKLLFFCFVVAIFDIVHDVDVYMTYFNC